MATRRPPLPALGPGDSADDVEARFYDALRRADLEALMALWADDDEIVCIHPGGGRLVGAAAIRSAFRAMFDHAGGLTIEPEQVHRLSLVGAAMHHLVERITVTTEAGAQTAYVVVSNVYVSTPQGWRLAAHHASPGIAEQASAGTPAVLH